MHASNRLSPVPQMEAGRVGATSRVDNPTEEVTPTEEVVPMEESRMDGKVDVGADVAHAWDMEDSKDFTTPTDGVEAVELMRVQDQASASTEASTDGPMVTVCT